MLTCLLTILLYIQYCTRGPRLKTVDWTIGETIKYLDRDNNGESNWPSWFRQPRLVEWKWRLLGWKRRLLILNRIKQGCGRCWQVCRMDIIIYNQWQNSKQDLLLESFSVGVRKLRTCYISAENKAKLLVLNRTYLCEVRPGLPS